MELSRLKGLGKKRIEALGELDIFSVEDLVAFLPRTYRDLTVVSQLNAVNADTPYLFKVFVVEKPHVRFPRKNFTVTTCMIEDISGRAEAVWFNQPYFAQSLHEGDVVYLYGEINIKNGRRRLMNPVHEHEDELEISPVYRLPASLGISQKIMRSLQKQATELCAEEEAEIFPDDFRAKHKLALRSFAVRNIHFPQSKTALEAARRRLCFEELLTVELYIKLRKEQNKAQAGKLLEIKEHVLEDFISKLPYKLTSAQINTLEEIKKDVTSGKAMNRLVQGDVGCGKTIIAFLSMLIAVSNGGQAVLMAPTDVLAHQHYLQAEKLFGSESVAFVSGSDSKQKRLEQLERVKNGAAKFIIGTSALIQKSVEYNNLLLIITDEQHRFGVAQRARLYLKGNSPHTLVMSATPIPRTLSLILFGDLDVSVINALPEGRKKVSTSIIAAKKENDMLQYIHEQLLSGKQAYFVCPRIEEDEETDMISAEGLFKKLSEQFFDCKIALMHGKLSGEERNKIIDDFSNGKIHALVSTTVIEVGVNVVNASIMVIYGADRFGLAQLHQLRGRVGRGETKSYCFMLTNTQNEASLERLKIMTQTNDGFLIAQKDFELRGPGDYLGKRQSGIPEARFSYALSNTLLLKETQQVLENEVLTNEALKQKLAKYIDKKFESDMKDIAYN